MVCNLYITTLLRDKFAIVDANHLIAVKYSLHYIQQNKAKLHFRRFLLQYTETVWRKISVKFRTL
jgi:hypothetical protein